MLANLIKVITNYWQLFLLTGLGYTLELSLIAVFFGSIIGALIALMRMSKVAVLRVIAGVYTEVVRGTPILLQLYFFYFLLPQMLPVLNPSKFVCVSVALVLNSAAYVSEVIRSGVQAVDIGQTEAARSLGLNEHQTMRKIVLPQAIKNILPALGNEFIAMVKETSLASTFFIGELMTQYHIVQGATYLVIEPLIFAGVIYLVVTFGLSKVVGAFERRMKASD